MISPQFLQNTLKQSDKELVKFFFIFSGDLPKLGYSELKAIFEIYNIDYDVIWLENQFCLNLKIEKIENGMKNLLDQLHSI